jgi:hypothetical protein
MTPAQVKASYQRALDDTVIVRRYSGTGPTRPSVDYEARARVTGYQPNELVGGIVQGDRRAIVYADDLTEAGLASILLTDKLVVRDRELAIRAVDDSTRRVDGELIAYELSCRG